MKFANSFVNREVWKIIPRGGNRSLCLSISTAQWVYLVYREGKNFKWYHLGFVFTPGVSFGYQIN